MDSTRRSPRRGSDLPTLVFSVQELEYPRYQPEEIQSGIRGPNDEDDITLPSPNHPDDVPRESSDGTSQGTRSEVIADQIGIFGASVHTPFLPRSLGGDSRTPTIVTDRTAVASVYDGGRQLEEEHVHKTRENYSDIEIPIVGPLGITDVDSLDDALHNALVKSVFLPGDTREFLPGNKLRRIVNPIMIDHLFGDDQLRIGLPSGHDSVGSLICPPRGSKNPSYQRIFATLLLVGNDMFKEIGNFIAEGINDTKLPLNLVYSLDNEPKALARSSMDETPLAFSRHHWRTRHLKDFVRCQWQVSPMFITSKRGEITHYKCREGEILPFMPVGPKQRLLFWGDNITPDPGVTNYGGNSVMFKCQIHESQQNLRRYTTNKSGRAIAVKKLQSTVLEDFINERRMLVRLTPNTTQHLSKLLATFETPYTSGNTPYHNYYLMFEWADMSLLDLWKRGHPTIIEQCTLSQWVAQQCQGLAKALDIIHEFKTHKSKSDPETRTHGFHGDIKPENILWYSNWEGCGHPFGVLQITDFGLSSFHNTTTAIDIKARMLDHVYSPPESKLARRISQSLDIWTLGCLFLDFAAWLADGMRGFDNFEGARMKEQFVKGWKEAAFYAVEEKIPGQTTVAINEKVIEWMQNLCGSLDRCSQFICDFVQVILDQMLVVENGEDAVDNGQSEDVDSAYDGSPDSEPSMSMSKRITAGQLALQLLKIVEKGETQEDYHVRGGQRIPNLRLHHDKRLQIVINESRKSVGEGIRKKRKHVETPSTAPAGGSSHLLAV